MFGSDFYHNLFRKYVTVFGTLFSDMEIVRRDANGNEVQAIEIPIAYGPKEKWLQRTQANPGLDKPIEIQLPRLAFEMVGFSYDGSRKLPSTVRNVAVSSDVNKLRYQYVGVPWNIQFNLYSYVRNADDGMQIIEQILPYFGPEWTLKMKPIPEMGYLVDIPLVLNAMNVEDVYDGDFDTRRALIHTYGFTMKAVFYGSADRHGSIIKEATINSHIFDFISGVAFSTSNTAESISIQPGRMANGNPTTNPAASIDPLQINANSSWTYASNTTFVG